jgi:hypothetical protein
MLTCIYPHDHDGTAVGILFCTSARIIIIRTNNVPMCVLKFDGVDENPKPPKNVIALSAISPIISVNRLTLTHNTQRSSLFLGRGCGGVEVAEADVCMYVCTLTILRQPYGYDISKACCFLKVFARNSSLLNA